MTLRAIAAELGTTPVTVYRKLKARGIAIETLRDASGNITSEGASTIASLFDVSPDEIAMQTALHQRVTQTEQVTPQVTEQVTPAEIEVAVLRERLAGTEERLSMVIGERDRLAAEVRELTQMLAAEQAQRQQLLTDGRGRGLFSWFRRRQS